MTPEAFRTLVMVLAPFVISWAVWVTWSHVRAQKELSDFKLKVADEYAKSAVTSLIFEKLDKMSRVVYEIAGKLQIPIQKD